MNPEKVVCPVDRTLSLINKKWSIQIIRDMFFGKKHFKEFKEDKPNLSNKVLSNCLKDLEKNGLIEKKGFEHKSHNYRILSDRIWAIYEQNHL